MSHKILLVDDDEGNLKSTKELLDLMGYQVDTMTNPLVALDTVKRQSQQYALVMIDQHMPQMKGTEFANELRIRKINQQVLIYSCDQTKDLIKESWKAGAVDFLEKQASSEQVLKTVRSFCIRYDEVIRPVEVSNSENSELISSLGMVGQSEELAEVCRQILKFSPFQQTVLILGETGVGKELVAGAIHNGSARSKRKFVAVNCGAIPENLVESTLFGHIKGAFTGATNNQLGKFQLADGGTIFLDEIGELSLEVQAKLLRILQERTVEPVGSKDSIKVDVRVIAATHRDLKKMVEDGQFRADLYHRLNVLELKVPALRERSADIEPLVHFFSENFCRENNRRVSFLKSAVRVLMTCEWKGNIRELKNVVERHLALADCDTVRKEDLHPSLFEAPTEGPHGTQTWQEHQESMRQQSLKFIEEILSKSASKSQAAQKLGLSRQHFHKLFESLSESKEGAPA
jgi:DNA-binding NtrC family response regulator